MEEAVFVHVRKSKHGLQHYALNLLFWERLCSVFHKLVNVLLHILEHEVQIVVHSDHLLQLHDVVVI